MIGSPEPDRPLNEEEERLWGGIERALADDRRLGRRLNNLSYRVGGMPHGAKPLSEYGTRSFIPEVNWRILSRWLGGLAAAGAIVGVLVAAQAHDNAKNEALTVAKVQVLGDGGILRTLNLCAPDLAGKAKWLEDREARGWDTSDEPPSDNYRAAEGVAEAQQIPCGDSTASYSTQVHGMTVTVHQDDFLR